MDKTIVSTDLVKFEAFNRKKAILKRQIDIFNDAVDLKSIYFILLSILRWDISIGGDAVVTDNCRWTYLV